MKRHTASTYNKEKNVIARAAIAIVVFITALAVAIACALCFNDGSAQMAVDGTAGEVTTSATPTNRTTGGDYSGVGALVVGDTFTLSYAASNCTSITLPAGGTFTLEVWGAQGGKGYSAYDIAGKGGYTKATYKTTAKTTIYVVVGGAGANWSGQNKTIAGGYNGGGSSKSMRTCSHGGGTGGGATHIATASGVLSGLSSNTASVLIVAGGGGGAGNNSAYSGGNGGGDTSGGTGYMSGQNAANYNATNGGAGGGNSNGTTTGGRNGFPGTFGKGGDSGYYSNYCGGAGAGGGWYGGTGGYAPSSCAAYGGGGGSSYVKSGLTDTVFKSGQQTGDGLAKITVVQVNQNPTSRGASNLSIKARGTGSTAIAASTLAQDPDYGNTSGASSTSVYFTAGSSSNLDTLPASNAGLWVNGTSTLATTYFDWTWSTTTLTITNVKKYPRAGVDGCGSDGSLTLYTRVRDSFGTTTTRGTAMISFTIKVAVNSISLKAQTATDFNSGNSTAVLSGTVNPTTAGSTIYNTTTGKRTVFIKKALAYNEAVTLTASSLIAGDNSGSTIFSGDTAVIALHNTTACASSVSGRKFKVDQLDANTNKVAAYDSAKAQIAGGNAFSQITIRALAVDSAYQVLPIRLYAVETATVGSVVNYCSAGIGYLDVDVVFMLENTRPTLSSNSNLVDLNVGETKSLALTSYFTDADGMNASSHTISAVAVPENEFVQLGNRFANKTAVVTTNAGNYNYGSGALHTNALANAYTTTTTGFSKHIAYNNTVPVGGTSANTAFMRFSYSGSTLTVVGLRSSFNQYKSGRSNALGHFYLLLNIRDTRNTADTGIWLPIAFRVGYNSSYAPTATVTAPNSVTGQTASTSFPTASGKAADTLNGTVGDSFYFAPMAINNGSSKVVGQYRNDAGNLTNSGLQALGIDGDNFTTDTGLAAWDASSVGYNEFLQLRTISSSGAVSDFSALEFVKSVSADGVRGDANKAQNKYIKAEAIDIYVPKVNFANGRVVADADTGLSSDGHTHILLNSGDSANYVTKGLKITLLSATMNRYFYGTVGLIDSTKKTVNNVNIAIRVNNGSPVGAADGTSVATDSAYSSYEYNKAQGNPPTITYRIPLGAKVAVTPYDFVSDRDVNVQAGGIKSKFTLNGVVGRYVGSTGTLISGGTEADGGTEFTGVYQDPAYGIDNYSDMLQNINSTSAVNKVSAAAAGSQASSSILTNQTVRADKLFFARSSDGNDAYNFDPATYNDIIASPTNTSGFVTYGFGSTVKIGATSQKIDFIVITAMSRTSQPAFIELTVRDRYGDGSDGAASLLVRIKIEVVNTAPRIKNADRVQLLASSPVDSDGNVSASAFTFAANGNTDPNGLMVDPDKDTPDFVTASGLMIANKRGLTMDEVETFASFTADPANAGYFTDSGVEGGRPLTDYITATLVSRYQLTVTALSSTKSIEGGVYVYFFVNDGNGGTSLGFVQIEVVDSAPVLNASDGFGFNEFEDGLVGTDSETGEEVTEKLPTWTIETTSAADIARNRYIVGSLNSIEYLKSGANAVDGDIKLIATDADALHGNMLLSPRLEATDGDKYVNRELPAEADGVVTIDKAWFKSAVPDVESGSTAFTENTARSIAATVYYRIKNADGGFTPSSEMKNYTAQMMYWIDGAWKDIDGFVNAVFGSDESKSLDALSTYIDGSGRFVYPYWALRLYEPSGMDSNSRVAIKLSVRDEASLGGDTANLATACQPLRSDKSGMIVKGALKTTVYQYIAQTGIRTKDEFSAYNDHYVVEHTKDNKTTAYYSTYDGDTTNAYDYGANIGYTGNKLDADGTSIKAGSGTADGTKAGANSGSEYTASGTAPNGAYRYPDTIEVPAASVDLDDENNTVYVPMSFFGMLQDLIGIDDQTNKGQVIYDTSYVGYDVGANGTAYVRGTIDDIASAISISDGVDIWTGTTGDKSLARNPYVTVGAFDDFGKAGGSESRFVSENSISTAYYNNRLAVLTVDGNDELNNLYMFPQNRNSFVGDGRLMYLEEQATKLQEHNFGLTFNKKNMRTGTRDLTLTVNLARSSWSATNNVVSLGDEPEDIEKNKRSISVKIHVENAKLELSQAQSGDNTVLKYDETKGTYYVDMTLATAQSKSFMLVRRDPSSGNVEYGNATYNYADRISYTDADYDNTSSKLYRDSAYFYADSFIKLGGWLSGESAYRRTLAHAVGETVLTNTAVNDEAGNKDQNSMLNYFGGSVERDGSYQPNGGMYGTNTATADNKGGNDGYSGYFNASLVDGGKVINIMATRKTFINREAFSSPPRTIADAKAEYLKRGLVAEYADGETDVFAPNRVYYPFKVLVYDDCGAGFTDGAYTSIEFRVEIVNAAPELKSVGEPSTLEGSAAGDRVYSVNLAVGNSLTVNLYDFIDDPDITASSQTRSLATKNHFFGLEGILKETGDYLDSPIAHDKYLEPDSGFDPRNCYRTADGTYYRNGGGFSHQSDTSKDVSMWMETVTSAEDFDKTVVPGTNNITFTVNRRTTAEYNGQSVSINEYRFTLCFYDSTADSHTQNLTFIIHVTNQTPRITTLTRNFTMHSGDDITILATYYDTFTGGATPSIAYENSATSAAFKSLTATETYIKYGAGTHNKGDSVGDDVVTWKFEQQTSDKASGVITNSDVNRERDDVRMHLGYFGLADDDTPWRLRITNYSYFNGMGARIRVDGQLNLSAESESTASSFPLALRVQALSACTNEPLTVTLDDGEGGVVSCTLYFTVISTSPVPLSKDIPSEANTVQKAGLEFDPDPSASKGTFRLYTVPSANSSFVIGGETKSARNEFVINMTDIAKDPDGDAETANMTLYGNGEFAVNGNPLTLGSDGIYHSDCFDIQVVSGGRAFRLVAKKFNAFDGFEKLTFRIADAGNGAYDNSIEITLNVYTLYADMTNSSAAALDGDKFTEYLSGGSVVNVKSYDSYYGAQGAVKSRFAQIKLNGNTGNDGNTVSPIVDPDVRTAGEQRYTTRLYALMDTDADNSFKAIPSATLAEKFTKDGAKGTFYLTDRSEFNSYLIGGISFDGTNTSVIKANPEAEGRLMEVNNYVEFEFSEDGTAVLFTPAASTLNNKNILLYVETEKYVDAGRLVKRDNAALAAGAVFRLNVEDSAPQTLTAAGMTSGVNQAVAGAKGDTLSLKIHDEKNPFNAMFIDSDAGDVVTINKFDDAAYAKAMAKAIAAYPELDWSGDDKGKPRAFTVDIDGETNTLRITINRRVDLFENNKYLPSVTFPIEFTGVDSMGKTAVSVVALTVRNTEAKTIDRYMSKYDSVTNVGYTFEVNGDGDYSISAQIKYSQPLTISLSDFMTDADSILGCDVDSYVFASSSRNIYPHEYLGNEVQKIYWYDELYNGTYDPDTRIELATVTPEGDDMWHRTGFTVSATNTSRTLTARTYLRVLDRSTDSSDRDTGVFITLDVTVMNDAPYILPDKSVTTEYMVGSDIETKGRLFFIGNYVADNNGSDVTGDEKSAQSQTYLRMFTHEPRDDDFEVYSTVHDEVSDPDSNLNSAALFEVTRPSQLPEDLLAEYLERNGLPDTAKDTSNRFNQWFVIKPIAGYYGRGAVDVTIADGDPNTSADTMLTTFRINIEVLCNPAESDDSLNSVTLACSKSVNIDIGKLMPDFENKLKLDTALPDGGADAEEGGGAEGTPSADGETDTFSQSSYYELTSVQFQNETDSSYAKLERVGESAVWRLTAGNQVTFDPIRVNVKFRMRNDPDREYSKYFRFNVIANQAPQAKYSDITFARYTRIEDGLHDLDDSNTVRLEAWQLFTDADDPDGSAIRLLSVKSQVSSIVKASLSEDNRYLVLTFAARGSSELTVEVTDETGTPVLLNFTVRNEDLPEGSLWLRISASFEANKVMWAIIIGCVLLLIVILIILISVLRKRRQAREELEALLVSEMEIEEQMLKLAGGPAPTDYSSFGYLPPSGTAPNDNMQMLGSGGGDNDGQPLAELPPPEDNPEDNNAQ